MNSARRKKISVIQNKLELVKTDLQLLVELLQTELNAEQLSYDNIPESLQETERAEKSSNCIDAMQDIIDILEIDFESIEESFNTIIE